MSAAQPAFHERLLKTFRRSANELPWYRTLLAEHGVRAEQVVDVRSFSSLCPVLTRQNTFDRFPLNELAATARIADLAGVLTSSGHGGRFSYGLSTRKQASASGGFIDEALDAAFGVKSRSTLAINCLPMGVGFTSECLTVATTSVREDMAVAIVQAFGSHYDQILIVADPLFVKRLTDYALAQGIDWRHYRPRVVLGEEIFGENFRGYVASCLGIDADGPEDGRILSSFGVGELGLHLCYETAATIALRRAAWRNPDLARELLGVAPGTCLPMVFAFNPQRTFIEVAEPDPAGYGRLTVSMLDIELPIPLLRYQPGDVGRLLEVNAVVETLRRHGTAVPAEMPLNLLALHGRVKEVLTNGSHVGVYKDALYADHAVARQLTGAFRVIAEANSAITMHVQLAASHTSLDSLEPQLLQAIPESIRPARLILWPYNRFPFGMTLDYERKFSYYVPQL
jgi:phenylacetate-CoA ligase